MDSGKDSPEPLTGHPVIIKSSGRKAGHPVIASLTGAYVVLVVVKHTVSGFNDFRRVLTVARQFKTVPCVCMNEFV